MGFRFFRVPGLAAGDGGLGGDLGADKLGGGGGESEGHLACLCLWGGVEVLLCAKYGRTPRTQHPS